MERMSEINTKKALLMLMTSLITSQCDVKVAWLQEMDTDSAYMSKSQYMQSYWFSNKSNNNIIYNISVMTITITIIIILANFGKYAISDCLFICLLLAKIYILASMFVGRVCYLPKFNFGKYVGWSCLSVCLFVRKFHKISRMTQSIITKLGHKQALDHDSCKFVGQECRSNN